MEVSSYIISVGLGFFFGTFIVTLVLWYYKRTQAQKLFKRHGFPGPKPAFLTGNMLDLRGASTPNDVLSMWREKYGDIFGYYIGDIPHLVIHDLDILKNVLIKDFANFVDRPKIIFQSKPLRDTLISLRGERWKHVRHTISPTFSAKKLKEMVDVMNDKVGTLLEVVGKQNGRPFNIYETVQALTLDVISACALDMKVNALTDPNDVFLKAVRTFFRFAHSPAVSLAIMFPPLVWMLNFINNRLTSGQMTSMIVDNLVKVIENRRTSPQNRRKDILQLLINASEGDEVDHTTDNFGRGAKRLLTDDEVIANAYLFLLGGYETTANALSYACYLLVKNPKVQERLYEEVSSCLMDNEHPSYHDINNLPYLDQVLNETLRIYPPITGFITRECSEDYLISDGRVIPKGVSVCVPVWDLHHNPEFWPDPWKFDPERFSAENKKNIHPLTFLPFGDGPRNCIGMRFGQTESKLTLARLVFKYRLVANDMTEDNITLVCPTVIINPKNGVYISAIPRD